MGDAFRDEEKGRARERGWLAAVLVMPAHFWSVTYRYPESVALSIEKFNYFNVLLLIFDVNLPSSHGLCRRG